MSERIISVFTKPWRTLSPQELAEHVAELGFNGIEFPLRDGYQVEPKNAESAFPAFVETMRRNGIAVASAASGTSENIFAALQAGGVDLLRIMADVDPKKSYLECESEWAEKLYALLPLCEKYGVRVGVQQHCGAFVFNTMELRRLLEKLDRRYIGGVWDAAHSGLAGEDPARTLDIIWDYLYLINFKNAYFKRREDAPPRFEPYFTTASDGFSDWDRAVGYALERGYGGAFCMPAEYTDHANTDAYAAQDLIYLKTLTAKRSVK